MAQLILFNKPMHVLPQFTDDQGRNTLAQWIKSKNCYPAGRLDYDSEGLMILTDDGRLQQQISNPKHKMKKSYFVQVEGNVHPEAIEKLSNGVSLNDGPTQPAQVSEINAPDLWDRHPPIRQRKNIPTSWLSITISEGRNRQVRRMTAAVGLPTLRLVRYQIGHWQLDKLQPGEYRTETVHLPKLNNRQDKPKRRR